MKFPYVLLLIFSFLLILSFLFAAFFRSYRRARKGKKGEKLVARELSRCKLKGDRILNDLYLFFGKDVSAQIDHVLFSRRGIFVIETKNLSGILEGDEKSERWVQTLAGGSIVHTFYNPVMQNQTHVNFLRRALSTQHKIFSVVIFAQGNIQKIRSSNVYTIESFKAFFASLSKDALSPSEIKRCFARLKELNRGDLKRRHLKNVKKRKKEKR